MQKNFIASCTVQMNFFFVFHKSRQIIETVKLTYYIPLRGDCLEILLEINKGFSTSNLAFSNCQVTMFLFDWYCKSHMECKTSIRIQSFDTVKQYGATEIDKVFKAF